MLLDILGGSLLGNMLAWKGMLRVGYEKVKKECYKLVMEIKWIFNATSSFNRL